MLTFADCRSSGSYTAILSEKDAKLAQKLGQLQPFIAVFPPECMGQLAYFGPTQQLSRFAAVAPMILCQGDRTALGQAAGSATECMTECIVCATEECAMCVANPRLKVRGVRSLLGLPPTNYRRFSAKLPKRGPAIFKRIVELQLCRARLYWRFVLLPIRCIPYFKSIGALFLKRRCVANPRRKVGLARIVALHQRPSAVYHNCLPQGLVCIVALYYCSST
jgi:hypothetical protein